MFQRFIFCVTNFIIFVYKIVILEITTKYPDMEFTPTLVEE